MRATPIGLLALVLTLGALSGCTSTGPISGQLVVPGQPPRPVTMTYTTDRYDAAGQITTTLPDGETFTGRFVQVTSTTAMDSITPVWSTFSAPMFSDWGPFGETWIGGPADVATFRTNYSGKIVATLFGDRSTVMRCRFQLVNPPGGIRNGGTGECQLSSGGQIDAQF